MDISKGIHIRDPIHGYVDLTGIEGLILNHRVAQRLQYVSQNGLAYLVYPEANTSRFSHSLGAMHLASHFLASALRNTDRDTRAKVGKAARKAVESASGKIAGPNRTNRDGWLLDNLGAHEALIAGNYSLQDYKLDVTILEQALRLAALFHDLGHLPYSHDFEGGLEEFWDENQENDHSLQGLFSNYRGGMKIHERLGHNLSLLLLKDLYLCLRNQPTDGARLSFELAQKILESTERRTSSASDAIIQWLHSLIDGELDVDRCDYILRDARNGLEFVNYDLERLLDNFVVVHQNKRFVSAIQAPGLSSIESFLISRYRSYQYGVRHHKVAQFGAALRYSIARLLSFDSESLTKFKENLADIASIDQISEDSQVLSRFALYDDIWWMSYMRNVDSSNRDEWLDLVCWRKDGPRSIWKRPVDFPGNPRNLRQFNEKLPRSGTDDEKRWKARVRELKSDGILVVRHYFSPWEKTSRSKESSLRVQTKDRKLKPVSALSPLVNGLHDAWMNDLQVHVFTRSDVKKSPDSILKKLRV